MAPTLSHCVWTLPPEGAHFALGRPSGKTLAPTLRHFTGCGPPRGLIS